MLGVGLGSSVYTWSAQTSEVKKLCDLSETDPPDSITSINWVQRVRGSSLRSPPRRCTDVRGRAQGNQVAVGTKSGMIQIWDAQAGRIIRRMTGHTARGASRPPAQFAPSVPADSCPRFASPLSVGALAWNDHILTSGSHDRLIYHRDVRIKDHWTTKLAVHRQEVCGLKWSDDGQLASGGNDNKLFVFDKMSEVRRCRAFELSP